MFEDLKIDQEDIIAFGDAEVDIPMFDFAGISVCVGNGREEAKKHATYVTKPVSEDGIKYALKHFEISRTLFPDPAPTAACPDCGVRFASAIHSPAFAVHLYSANRSPRYPF